MKERITVTLDRDLLDWIDKRVETKVFANRSHAFEFLIKQEDLRESTLNKYVPPDLKRQVVKK